MRCEGKSCRRLSAELVELRLARRGHRAACPTGAVVEAWQGRWLPRFYYRAPGGRGRAPRYRHIDGDILRRRDRRSARRRVLHRHGAGTRPLRIAANPRTAGRAQGRQVPRARPHESAGDAAGHVDPAWRRAEIGGANGHGNARGSATVQSILLQPPAPTTLWAPEPEQCTRQAVRISEAVRAHCSRRPRRRPRYPGAAPRRQEPWGPAQSPRPSAWCAALHRPMARAYLRRRSGPTYRIR